MAESGRVVDEKKICGVPERVQLHVSMLALQFGYAGFHVVSRAALNMGISKVVYPVYRNIIALLLLVPFAYFLEKYVSNLTFFSQSLLFSVSCFINQLNSVFFLKFSDEGIQERQASDQPQVRHPVLPPRSMWV